MVDIFALAVSHALLALAVWRLLSRDDLYDDAGPMKAERKVVVRNAATREEAAPDA